MTDDCIFCAIVDGEIPSRTVYEDETTVAFLDVNPLAPGHTLIVPKTHRESVQDLPDDVAADLYATLQRVIPAAETAVDADASSVGFNNGEASGQEIPHVHAHVIPRFEGDRGGTLHTMMGGLADIEEDELDEYEAAIAERL